MLSTDDAAAATLELDRETVVAGSKVGLIGRVAAQKTDLVVVAQVVELGRGEPPSLAPLRFIYCVRHRHSTG